MDITLQTLASNIKETKKLHFLSITKFPPDMRAFHFSIRTVVNSGKICVLNLQPSSLPSIHESDLKPYVVFLTPASPQLSRAQATRHGQLFKVT